MQDMHKANPKKLKRKPLEQIRDLYVVEALLDRSPHDDRRVVTAPRFRRVAVPADSPIQADKKCRQRGRDTDDELMQVEDYPDQPDDVEAVPRFESDLEAMSELCHGNEPPLMQVRCRIQGSVYYGFGDASKPGFRATIQIGDKLFFEYGQWTTEEGESNSSNWRELNNLVLFMEKLFGNGEMDGCEMFMFTDNSTAEAAFWKGMSKSRKLFELVLRLKKMEARHDLILHVVHVSGRRMIHQGTDGITRGDQSQGVMRGFPMTAYVPLHLDPFEREPRLKVFMEEVTHGIEPKFLSPEGWFDEGQGLGTYVWSAAPAAAEVVVEQLGTARLKRPQSMHIFVVPRLMTGRWRRHMSRGTDFYFKMDWSDIWPLKDHFEPVLIFVCLPYSSHRPNFTGVNKLLDKFRGSLLQDELSALSQSKRRDILRKLFIETRALCPMRRRLVWGVLYPKRT
eukprot:scaffold29206_cov30-Attheya_sp.AAC.3